MHFSDKNSDDLQYLLSYTNFFLDIIAVSEAKITKQEFLLNILNLIYYSYHFDSIKTSARGHSCLQC